MNRLFCFGLGYCASAVAERLLASGWAVAGTARAPENVSALAARGYDAYLFDGTSPSRDIATALEQTTHVLLSIPPGASGDPAFLQYAPDLRTSTSLAWIGYFSTIGVYGDASGGWVDESTPPRPGSERGRRRLTAESQWLDLGNETRKPAVIFRLPGIYGPGRNSLSDVEAGTARRIVKPGQYFNRAHVEDIASAVVASLDLDRSRIFNVTDDMPAPPEDVIAYGAELLGRPCPPPIAFEDAKLSPMGLSFYSESKRVSNARMKAELGVRLRYPTYIEGLRALAANFR